MRVEKEKVPESEELEMKPGDDTARAQPSIEREGASTGNTGAGSAGNPGAGESGGDSSAGNR